MRTFAQQPRTPAIDQNRLADDLATGRIGPRGALEQIAASYGWHDIDPADLRNPITPAAALTTSDYTSVVSAVADRFLLPFESGYVPTWPTWAARSTLNRMSGRAVVLNPVQTLTHIYEGEESRPAQATDDDATVTLARYGADCTLTFEATLGDDLGAFKTELQQLGNAARKLEDDVAYAALIAGASSLNAASSAGVPTQARLDSCLAKLASLTGANGARLNTRGSVLLCPPEIHSQAAQSAFEINTVSDNKITVISDGRLSVGSLTQWYLFASPGILPAFAVTMLAGHEEPELQVMNVSDGQKFFVRHNVGATLVNVAGAVRNAGA